METIYPGAAWVCASPESQGLATDAVERTLRRILDAGADLHALLVVKNGYLVCQRYLGEYTPETLHQIYSASKTFTSMTVGAAVMRGLLSLDDPVLRFFPEADPGPAGGRLRRMTVRHLLTMSAGHESDPYARMAAGTEPWWKVFLETPVRYEPGTRFLYETGDSYLLSAILTRVTGKPLLELVREWLLTPMEAGAANWRESVEGCSAGGSDMEIAPESMARLGLMMLSRGMWGERRLVPEAYIRQASRRQIYSATDGVPEKKQEARQGYGLQTWMCSFGCWRAEGMSGQIILMCPAQNMVVVTTCAMDNNESDFLLDAIREQLLPGCADAPLPEAPEKCAALDAYWRSVTEPVPPAGARVPEGRWEFEPGDTALGLRELELRGDTARVCLREGEMTLRWRWNRPVVSRYTRVTVGGWKPVPVSASMVWRGYPVLRLHSHTDGRTDELRLRPMGNWLRVTAWSTHAQVGTVMSLGGVQ